MKDAILSDAMPHGVTPLSHYVDVAATPWQAPFPGMRMKVLYKDNAAKQATILVQTEPGTVIPEHVHGGVEQILILEGQTEDDDGVQTTGNFVVRLPGKSACAAHAAGGHVFGVLSGVGPVGGHRKPVP